MAEVIENSLHYLSPDDLKAMIAYLRRMKPQPDEAPPAKPALAKSDLGERLFVQSCIGCHLPNGEGRQSPWAALGGSHTASDPGGTNLMQVLLHVAALGRVRLRRDAMQRPIRRKLGELLLEEDGGVRGVGRCRR